MSQPSTIAALAIAMPRSIAVFQRLKIDYCCHGDQAIQQACSGAGITTDELMALINAEPATAEVRKWDHARVTDIIAFINDTHHAYTRQSCETLQWMSAKVATRHGAHHPELVELSHFVAEIIDDLLPHMMKEEQVLFPYAMQLDRGETAYGCFGTARNPVRMMMLEHEAVGEKLDQMRGITSDYALPDDACTTYTAYFNLLQELERDLHNHIHLENNILFPRIIELEETVPAAMTGAAWGPRLR